MWVLVFNQLVFLTTHVLCDVVVVVVLVVVCVCVCVWNSNQPLRHSQKSDITDLDEGW